MIKSVAKKDVFFWFFTLLVTLPLYFRGLFFQQDFAIFSIIAMAFIIGSQFLKEAKLSFNFSTDLSLGLLVLFYIVSSFFSVNLGLALGEVSKYLVVYIIYLAAKAFFADEPSIRKALYAIVVVVAGMSLISLSSAAGLVIYPGAYSDVEIERWLNGTVQYHNAFGALTLMALFIACALGKFRSIKSAYGWGLAVCAYLLTFGLIMSYSRGAWILAPILLIIFMIFGDKAQRIAFFTHLIPAGVAVLTVISPFSASVVAANTAMACTWFGLGLLISAVLYAFLGLLFQKIGDMKYFNITAIIVIALSILFGVLVVLMPQWFTFIPEQLLNRISGINLGSETVKERFVFYKDAFEIAKRNIVIGNGGGAWQDLYGMYQSYLYFSTQAHSYIMQILVETGILGILAWISGIVLFYISAIRAAIKKTVSKDILNAIICGASALILHSLIDFDLSLPAITIVLWVLIAMMSALAAKKEYSNLKINIAGIVLSAVLLITSVSVVASYGAHHHANAYMMEKNYEEAYKKYDQATFFSPFNSEYLADQALARAQNSKKVSNRQEAVALFEKAEAMAPYNLDVQRCGVGVYSAIGSEVYAMQCVENSINIQPMNPNGYIAFLQSATNIMPSYIASGNYDKARVLASSALEIPARAEKASEGKLKPVELPMGIAEYLVYFAKILQSLSMQ